MGAVSHRALTSTSGLTDIAGTNSTAVTSTTVRQADECAQVKTVRSMDFSAKQSWFHLLQRCSATSGWRLGSL